MVMLFALWLEATRFRTSEPKESIVKLEVLAEVSLVG
jgi:hypothetical protein